MVHIKFMSNSTKLVKTEKPIACLCQERLILQKCYREPAAVSDFLLFAKLGTS